MAGHESDLRGPSRGYLLMISIPTGRRWSTSRTSNAELNTIRLFEHLRHADLAIKARLPSGCRCTHCIVHKGHALAEALAAVARWYRGLTSDIQRTNHLAMARDMFRNIVADFLLVNYESHGFKVPPEVFFYWLLFEIVLAGGRVSPLTLIVRLERERVPVARIHEYYCYLSDRLATERIQRRCGPECKRYSHRACFTDRMTKYLFAYIDTVTLMRRTILSGGDNPGSHVPRTCAWFGCGATGWTDDGAVAVDNQPSAAAEPTAPLRPCIRCHKAFYCSTAHASDSRVVHQLVCDMRRREGERTSDARPIARTQSLPWRRQ